MLLFKFIPDILVKRQGAIFRAADGGKTIIPLPDLIADSLLYLVSGAMLVQADAVQNTADFRLVEADFEIFWPKVWGKCLSKRFPSCFVDMNENKLMFVGNDH